MEDGKLDVQRALTRRSTGCDSSTIYHDATPFLPVSSLLHPTDCTLALVRFLDPIRSRVRSYTLPFKIELSLLDDDTTR